jgi:putative transposase
MTISSPKFKGKYRIPSNRLKGWDYGTPGYYFVTICTQISVPWFGEIEGNHLILSPSGDIAVQNLESIPHIYQNICLDAWVVMPNHIHAIIIIGEITDRQVEIPRAIVETLQWDVSTDKRNWGSGTLGAIINQYKAVCTKRIGAKGCTDFAWQARFYDYIIRNEKSLANIRAYILGIPIKWTEDEYFSDM